MKSHFWKKWPSHLRVNIKSIAWCKTALSPLLMHWRYYSLALCHWKAVAIILMNAKETVADVLEFVSFAPTHRLVSQASDHIEAPIVLRWSIPDWPLSCSHVWWLNSWLWTLNTTWGKLYALRQNGDTATSHSQTTMCRSWRQVAIQLKSSWNINLQSVSSLSWCLLCHSHCISFNMYWCPLWLKCYSSETVQSHNQLLGKEDVKG